MKHQIIFVLCIISAIGRNYAFSPVNITINSDQPVFNTYNVTNEPGNLYAPKWSPKGNFIGVDCYSGDKISVLVYSVNQNITGKYNVGASQHPSSHSHMQSISVNLANTLEINWSPESESNFFVTSSLKQKYDLFWVQMILNSGKYLFKEDNKTEKIPNLQSMHISQVNFKKNPRNLLFGVFCASMGNNNDIYIYEREPDKIEIKRIGIVNDHSKYEPDYVIKNNNSVSLVYSGISTAAQDIYYLTDIKNPSQIKNLTNTSNAVEKNPKFSSSGRYIAYVSTADHVNLASLADTAGKEIDLKYGLRIYDTETGEDKEMFYPVYIDPKFDRQSAFTWLPDGEQLLVIANDIPAKEPLYCVNIRTGTAINLNSPLYHHHDVETSPDGKKVALTARGHRNNEDFSTLKLFIAEIR